jgi:hypothetical protein
MRRAASRARVESSDLGLALRAEWTKFRTVRGWLVSVVFGAALCVGFTFVVANGNHEGGCTGPPRPGSGPNSPGSNCSVGHPFVPTGPDGQAVADSYEFAEQPLTGNSTITARIRSLSGVISTNRSGIAPSLAHTRPGLPAWAKAGLLLTPSTKQGAPYAAVIATAGHGVRFQYNYTHDHAGPPAGATRWVRLSRTGATLTAYDSTDGRRWTRIGTTRLASLPRTVHVGLFVTSPVLFKTATRGAPTQATATFDHVATSGSDAPRTWRVVGAGPQGFYPTLGSGSAHRSGATFVISGSGDIAPAVALAGGNTASGVLDFGLLVALIVLTVVATLFITVEYRRGLIRTTFTATPRRRRVLAAKAIVIGAVAFVIVTLAAAAAVPLGHHILNANGNYIFPTTALSELRVVAGSGALIAASAVTALALGTILRSSAGAVATGIVMFVLPYTLAQLVSGSAQEWLFRLTPSAGFAVLDTLPRSAQVSYPYTYANGYYPLSPFVGLGVACAYAALAVGLAAYVMRRRDA